jgi:hypothetical protein
MLVLPFQDINIMHWLVLACLLIFFSVRQSNHGMRRALTDTKVASYGCYLQSVFPSSRPHTWSILSQSKWLTFVVLCNARQATHLAMATVPGVRK